MCMSAGVNPDMANALREAGPMGVANMSAAYVGDLVCTCSPQPMTLTPRWRQALNLSSRVTTTAPPPATGITISSMRKGSATMREASTSSTVMGWA